MEKQTKTEGQRIESANWVLDSLTVGLLHCRAPVLRGEEALGFQASYPLRWEIVTSLSRVFRAFFLFLGADWRQTFLSFLNCKIARVWATNDTRFFGTLSSRRLFVFTKRKHIQGETHQPVLFSKPYTGSGVHQINVPLGLLLGSSISSKRGRRSRRQTSVAFLRC